MTGEGWAGAPGDDEPIPFDPEPLLPPGAFNRVTYGTVAPEPPSDLQTWWMTVATTDYKQMEPKVGEYTASDLVLMGQFMEHWLGLPAGSGAEAACMFYLLGKVARAVSAYREGRLPSDDTLHDMTVYSMMARRIRETGGWP